MSQLTEKSGTVSEKRDDEVVCACTNLTRGELLDHAAQCRGSFDEFLKTKGTNGVTLGQRCTACLLDLEYLFTTRSTDSENTGSRSTPKAFAPDSKSIRRRIFGFIDRWSPLVPVPLWDSIAVLNGPEIRQTLVIANDRLLFQEQVGIPPLRVEVTVRDADGVIRHHDFHEVPVGDCLRKEVSQFLPAPGGDELGIGTLQIKRRFRAPGYRGTTRPQILLDARSSSAAVHCQGLFGPGDHWVSFTHQRETQRMFVALCNHTPREMQHTIDLMPNTDKERAIETVLLPPYGAHLSELRVPKELDRVLEEQRITVRIHTDNPGGRKINFISANKDLSRISIDHPS